ncbi:990_t:CDS:2, partial [Scutellospora calospora]
VLMQQPENTVGFFVSNARFSTRSKNLANNSKVKIVLCDDNNLIDKIKEAQRLHSDSDSNTVCIENITTDENTQTEIFGIKFKGSIRIGKLIRNKMFKIKTTEYLDELESSLKKLRDIVSDKKEYVFVKRNMSEAERIIIDQDIDETLQIVRYEFQPEFEKRIEQESFKRLKRKYPENFYKTVKRQKVEPKVIILTGGIGVGKTIFGEKFAKYLEDKELKVYRPVETSLKIKHELDLFYKDVEKRALFFQYVILETYKKEVEKINRLTGYDYVIFDRTHIDTEVFTHHNIKEQD